MIAVSSLAKNPDADELRRHLELGETDLVRSTEDMVRAERQLARVSSRLDRNFLRIEYRQIETATAASAEARERVERALAEVRVALEHLR